MQIPKLREWRESRALTQVELAERAGVSSRSVAGYEAGRGARPPTVRNLADALDVGIADLLEEASPKGSGHSSLEPKLFNGLEGEWRSKLEESERAVQYIAGRAEYWEQELERGHAQEYATYTAAQNLAALAIDEFSRFYRWFFDVVARDLVREIENGNASELVDEFDSLEETFIERVVRTQRMLLDNAARLAETEAEQDEVARRRKTADANVKKEQRSA